MKRGDEEGANARHFDEQFASRLQHSPRFPKEMPSAPQVFEDVHRGEAVDAFRTERQRVCNQINLVKDGPLGLNGSLEVPYVNCVDAQIFSQELESFQIPPNVATQIHEDRIRRQSKNEGGSFFQERQELVQFVMQFSENGTGGHVTIKAF
jgi:hypothetical protein